MSTSNSICVMKLILSWVSAICKIKNSWQKFEKYSFWLIFPPKNQLLFVSSSHKKGRLLLSCFVLPFCSENCSSRGVIWELTLPKFGSILEKVMETTAAQPPLLCSSILPLLIIVLLQSDAQCQSGGNAFNWCYIFVHMGIYLDFYIPSVLALFADINIDTNSSFFHFLLNNVLLWAIKP